MVNSLDPKVDCYDLILDVVNIVKADDPAHLLDRLDSEKRVQLAHIILKTDWEGKQNSPKIYLHLHSQEAISNRSMSFLEKITKKFWDFVGNVTDYRYGTCSLEDLKDLVVNKRYKENWDFKSKEESQLRQVVSYIAECGFYNDVTIKTGKIKVLGQELDPIKEILKNLGVQFQSGDGFLEIDKENSSKNDEWEWNLKTFKAPLIALLTGKYVEALDLDNFNFCSRIVEPEVIKAKLELKNKLTVYLHAKEDEENRYELFIMSKSKNDSSYFNKLLELLKAAEIKYGSEGEKIILNTENIKSLEEYNSNRRLNVNMGSLLQYSQNKDFTIEDFNNFYDTQ